MTLRGPVRDTALVPIAVRLTRAVEGVVDVDPELTGAPTAVRRFTRWARAPPPVEHRAQRVVDGERMGRAAAGGDWQHGLHTIDASTTAPMRTRPHRVRADALEAVVVIARSTQEAIVVNLPKLYALPADGS